MKTKKSFLQWNFSIKTFHTYEMMRLMVAGGSLFLSVFFGQSRDLVYPGKTTIFFVCLKIVRVFFFFLTWNPMLGFATHSESENSLLLEQLVMQHMMRL